MNNGTLALIIAIITAAVVAADKILRLVAPKTKTTLDDRIVVVLDKLVDVLGKLGGPTAILLVLLLSPSCSWLKSEGKAVASATIDCTRKEAASAIAQFAPLVENALASTASADGKLDAATAKQIVRGFATETGGCVAAKAFASLLHPAPEGSDAPRSSPLEIDPVSARAAFEALRREQFSGATFRLADGTL